MPHTSIDLFELFIGSPGETLFFLTVLSVSLASFFMLLGQRLRHPQDSLIARYRVALLGVVIVWLLLLGGVFVAGVINREAVSIIPPLERFAGAMTVLILSWAFIEQSQPRREMRLAVLAFTSVLTLGYLLTAVLWLGRAGEIDFNLSVYGLAWTAITLLLSLIGAALVGIYARDVVDAPLKLVVYGVMIAGSGWTFLQIVQGNIIGDYAGPLRLAQVIALVLAAAIVYRAVIGRLQKEIVAARIEARQATPVPATPPQSPPPVRERSPLERESVQLLRTLGLILETATANTIPERIVAAVIELLKVDMAGILRVQDANYIDFTVVHDSVMNRDVPGLALNLDQQPTLANAIDQRAQRALLPDRDDDELQDVYTRLDIDQVGPVYFQPLTSGGDLIAVLMLAHPYSGRVLYSAEEDLLRGIAVIAGGLLALSYTAEEARIMAEERAIQAMLRGVPTSEVGDSEILSARQETEASLELAREQIGELSQQVSRLQKELEQERDRVAASLIDTEDGLSVSQQMTVVNKQLVQLQDDREQLMKRVQEAEAALSGATAADGEAVYKNMIRALQREKQDLQIERDRLQIQLDRLHEGVGMPLNPEAMLARMAEEKTALEQDRDRLRSDLQDIEHQLESVGVSEGTSGLADLIGRLYEQNARLQADSAQLRQEVEAMSSERERLLVAIEREEDRVVRIRALENQVQNLAGDREVLTKQRDKLRAELDAAAQKQDVIKEQRARLMAQAAGLEMALKEAEDQQQVLRQERDHLLEQVKQGASDGKSRGKAGFDTLSEMIDNLTAQRNELARELHITRMTLSELRTQLEQSQVQNGAVAPNTMTSGALLLSLVQELRTPMTSINGYIELLLGESAGILGEMQRKFLQRVSTNITRLVAMLEDLVFVTELDTGHYKLEYSKIDVVALIENAIMRASNQFREKGLTINLALDDGVPPIRADQEAIHQVIGQLLTNAYLVSPPESEISVRASRRRVDFDGREVESLQLSVEDRGGGILPEDIDQVFTRRYRAENPLIEGLGDTGVGLAVARALVEAHGGRITLDSHEGQGTVFTVELPFTAKDTSEMT